MTVSKTDIIMMEDEKLIELFEESAVDLHDANGYGWPCNFNPDLMDLIREEVLLRMKECSSPDAVWINTKDLLRD